MNELNDYINYLSLERQLSTNTIDGYKRDLEDFYKYTDKKYKNIDKNDIINYISYLNKKVGAKTINRHIVSIKNYFKYLERDKHEAALADSGLTEKDLEDKDFLNAYHKYQELQDADPILALIKTAYHTIYKMRVHLDSIDFSEVDVDGKPLYKPKDVIGDLTSISKIRSELQTLEELHKTNQEATAQVRGQVPLGMLD